MRPLVLGIAIVTLLALITPAYADDVSGATNSTSSGQPLAPGGAAGVHKAQLDSNGTSLILAGGALALATGAVLVFAPNNHNHVTVPTTTSTTNTTGK
jgi:hypothetical protein